MAAASSSTAVVLPINPEEKQRFNQCFYDTLISNALPYIPRANSLITIYKASLAVSAFLVNLHPTPLIKNACLFTAQAGADNFDVNLESVKRGQEWRIFTCDAAKHEEMLKTAFEEYKKRSH